MRFAFVLFILILFSSRPWYLVLELIVLVLVLTVLPRPLFCGRPDREAAGLLSCLLLWFPGTWTTVCTTGEQRVSFWTITFLVQIDQLMERASRRPPAKPRKRGVRREQTEQ